jgi:hypothetical protein
LWWMATRGSWGYFLFLHFPRLPSVRCPASRPPGVDVTRGPLPRAAAKRDSNLPSPPKGQRSHSPTANRPRDSASRHSPGERRCLKHFPPSASFLERHRISIAHLRPQRNAARPKLVTSFALTFSFTFTHENGFSDAYRPFAHHVAVAACLPYPSALARCSRRPQRWHPE